MQAEDVRFQAESFVEWYHRAGQSLAQAREEWGGRRNRDYTNEQWARVFGHADHILAAEAFWRFHEQNKGTLCVDFHRWSVARGFALRDRRCIYGIVTEHALSTGEFVATDPAWEPANCQR